ADGIFGGHPSSVGGVAQKCVCRADAKPPSRICSEILKIRLRACGLCPLCAKSGLMHCSKMRPPLPQELRINRTPFPLGASFAAPPCLLRSTGRTIYRQQDLRHSETRPRFAI